MSALDEIRPVGAMERWADKQDSQCSRGIHVVRQGEILVRTSVDPSIRSLFLLCVVCGEEVPLCEALK